MKKAHTSKTIPISETEKMVVLDHAELGVSIQRHEKQSKGRFKAVEDTLVPRDAVANVCMAMLRFTGHVNISWEK